MIPNFLPLALSLVATFVICLNKNSRADEPQFQKIWEAIRTAETTEYNPSEFPIDYWAEIAGQCSDHFEEVTKIKNIQTCRKFMTYYADQFGRHGPQADIRWLLVNVKLTIPDWAVRPPLTPRTGPWSRIPEEFSEAIVRRCLADKQFLHRYYVAVLYTGMFIRPPDKDVQSGQVQFGFYQSTSVLFALRHTHDELPKGDTRYHWQFLRRFMLLAHAIGRDDLFNGVHSDELEKQVPRLWEWYLENWPFLRPSTGFRWKLDRAAKKNGEGNSEEYMLTPLAHPKHPFPDWKEGIPPPPVDLFRQI